jgi:serine/threonine protein kinase
MQSTVLFDADSLRHTDMPGGDAGELLGQYLALVQSPDQFLPRRYRNLRLLAKGQWGVVYFGERHDADRFFLPVALKAFSPEPYRDAEDYAEGMCRIEDVASSIARIQHANVVEVRGFVEQSGIRVMEMEWIDGLNLGQTLIQRMLDRTRVHVTSDHWEYVSNQTIAAGRNQPRLEPSAAIQILRDCLKGLSALHEEAIVHGDIKPSNIMIQRMGVAKIIDLGSANYPDPARTRIHCSPYYAAPEMLRGAPNTPHSDLTSLGYVFIEMLAGRSLFNDADSYKELTKAKEDLDGRLSELLPPVVGCNESLLHLCRQLVAVDPAHRFANAQAAEAAAAYVHRELVRE